MKDNFSNKHRKFSIRKLKIGIASVVVGLAFTDALVGVNHVEASMSVEDANYVNQTAVDNASLVEYIHQALETIAKGAKSTVLPTSIQNLKNKVQALSTKQESDYEASAWQEFQEKLTTAKSKLEEVENTYNEAVKINSNAQAYDTTIKELIASYPEYNTVVITVRDGETEDTAGVRHISNLRRINGVLTAKYAELRQIASSMKSVLPPVGEDLAAQQLKKLESAETILEVNKKTATVAESEHQDLIAGLFENNKVVLSNLSTLRGEITPADQTKITTFLKIHVPSLGETAVFQTYAGALQYRFNNDGTLTITYTDDGSSDTVPLSIFAKGGATQTDSPATTYSVTYNYVSGTPDKSLPSNITAPAVVSDKHPGDVVASPTGQTDVADSVNQGTWHFSAWDKASVTIGTTNETVTGTWEFIPTPPATTYNVTYKYVSGTPDKSLPSNITAPEAVSDKHPGDVVASPTGQTDVEDTANKGVWHFTSWDKASVTVGTADETVTGTWTFTATPESTTGTTPAATYSVMYRYISGTEGKSLPSNITTGWIKKDGRWWYQHADGSYTTNGWERIEGIWYHFDQSGWMQTGWIKTGDSWYYLNKSGSMAIGWVKDNGIWYYLNNSGAMKTGWVKDNTTWYYLDNSGAMKTGWFKVSGKWYYAYSSGALAVDTTTPDGYKVSANGEWVEDR